MKRKNLYMFRHNKELSMQEMSKKTGVSRMTYSYIESGNRFGCAAFWDNLQHVFDLSDDEVRKLQKTEERTGE